MKKFQKNAITIALVFVFSVCIVPLRMDTAQALTMTYAPSSYYQSSVYYSRLLSVTLTGNARTDLVNVAASQVGYHEGNSKSELGGYNTSGTGNYTEYAYWFGPRVRNDSNFWYAWCAMFISWCARQAGISERSINNSSMATCDGNTSSTDSYAFHIAKKTKDTYTPQPGDLIFFKSSGTSSGQHVGIVEYVSGGYIHTIEGNASNQVIRRSYLPSNSNIVYYGVMNGDGSVTPPSYSTTWDIGTYTITASSLNIRQAPTTGASVVGSYPNGTIVTIYEYLTDGSWGRTDDGWISMNYVSRRYETISVNASTYEKGDSLIVTPGNARNYPDAWIGIYRQGEVEDPYTTGGVEAKTYQYIGSNTSLSFDTSSLEAGTYYARAYCSGGLSAYVKISDPVYFTVTEKSLIYTRDADMYTILTAINMRSTPKTGSITGVLEEGRIIPIYEVYDFEVPGGLQRWGRTDGGWIAMVSSADLTTPYCIPYKKAVSLSSTYVQGSKIIVTVEDVNNAAYSDVWIGIYSASDIDRSESVSGAPSILWANATVNSSGNAVISFPDANQSDKGTSYTLPAGNYYARLFCTVGSDSNISLSDKVPLRVDAIGSTATLGASSSYERGATAKVDYSGQGMTSTAWIGLYPASQNVYNADHPSILWQYISSSNGTVYFHTTGLAAGAYKFVIFKDEGYTALNAFAFEVLSNTNVYTAAEGTYRITASALNIRSYPVSGTIYGQYLTNDIVTVHEIYQTSTGALWGRTDIGWIAMNYAAAI